MQCLYKNKEYLFIVFILIEYRQISTDDDFDFEENFDDSDKDPGYLPEIDPKSLKHH